MSDPHPKSIDEIKSASLEKAKAAFKGNTGLSRAMAKCADPPTPQAISQWKQVPVERVNDVEAVSGVSRHLLRPDIFGLPDQELVDVLFAEEPADAADE